MFWFKSRPQQRKVAKKRLRLGVEQLESRVATGTIWSPGSAIDISGIINNGGIFAAGQIVEFSIIGTGNDFDQWYSYEPGGFSGGQTQDTVTITWSGASCQLLDGGRRALCQLGSAGAPDTFNISMQANDSGAIPAGDSGNRDDSAVVFNATVYGIWATISLDKGPGSLQGVYPTGGFQVSGFANDELGPATVRSGVAGLWSKVELTANIFHPTVPDGTGQFHWFQEVDYRRCSLSTAGTVSEGGFFRSVVDESPKDQFQTHQTVNSKVYMTDIPGGPELNGQFTERHIDYFSFTTWVTFNEFPVSAEFEWHVTYDLTNDGNGSLYTNPVISVGAGHDPNRPNIVGQLPAESGPIHVDCSTQPFIG